MFRLFITVILIDDEQANAGFRKRPVRTWCFLPGFSRVNGLRNCRPVNRCEGHLKDFHDYQFELRMQR